MNRVAVITDIHANLPALEATLSEIERAVSHEMRTVGLPEELAEKLVTAA